MSLRGDAVREAERTEIVVAAAQTLEAPAAEALHRAAVARHTFNTQHTTLYNQSQMDTTHV